MRINDFDSHDVSQVMHSASLLGLGSLVFWTAIKSRTSVLLTRFTTKDLSLALKCMANLEASDDKFLSSLGQRFMKIHEREKGIDVQSIYDIVEAFHKLHEISIRSGFARKGLSQRNISLIQLFAKLFDSTEMQRGLSEKQLLKYKSFLEDLTLPSSDNSLKISNRK